MRIEEMINLKRLAIRMFSVILLNKSLILVLLVEVNNSSLWSRPPNRYKVKKDQMAILLKVKALIREVEMKKKGTDKNHLNLQANRIMCKRIENNR